MKIDRVTITGADDATNPMDLIRIQEKYPFVEWGILFSITRMGQPRYPSTEWQTALNKARSTSEVPLRLSAHLCGAYSRNLMEYSDPALINLLAPAFQRFQVNYNFTVGHDWKLIPIINFAKQVKDIGKSFIFQHNKSNDYAISKLVTNPIDNIHILYDSSGGRGNFIGGNINLPFLNRYTGYSGGLGPDNIKMFLDLLYYMKTPDTVWVDMESGVRTDNKLDIGKVESVLEIANEFISSNQNQ